jgi:hypothetical protein
MSFAPGTEFSDVAHRSVDPYLSLANKTGRPVKEIVELALQDKLSELFCDGELLRTAPMTGSEAQRYLERHRHSPGLKVRAADDPFSLPGSVAVDWLNRHKEVPAVAYRAKLAELERHRYPCNGSPRDRLAWLEANK